ncbi:MAG: CarD family transcriptional regulator [Acidobacteriota bacterium]
MRLGHLWLPSHALIHPIHHRSLTNGPVRRTFGGRVSTRAASPDAGRLCSAVPDACSKKGVASVTFEVGQKVVYPNHGVSVVEEISSAKFDDTETILYHLRLLSNNSKVMVPKDNLELVGLRPLGDKALIQSLFDNLEDGNIDTYKDWKGRYKQNLDKMKTGQLEEVAGVLKNLCLVSQKKSLSFREKKMYERAKYFIVSEVAHVKSIDEPAAEKLVDDSLAASLEKLANKKKDKRDKEAAEEVKAEGNEELETEGVEAVAS